MKAGLVRQVLKLEDVLLYRALLEAVSKAFNNVERGR